MGGLDGNVFVDVALLGPEWHVEKTVPASDVYSDSETAIWDMCPGCANERGWLEVEHAHGPMCQWMYEAGEYDGKPMVDLWVGPNGLRFTQCHHRREPWVEGEHHERSEGQMALFELGDEDGVPALR